MVIAFILATTKTGREKEVMNALLNIEEIREAHSVYGDYDLFIKVEAMDLDKLNEFIIEKIRSIPHIVMTTTMIGL